MKSNITSITSPINAALVGFTVAWLRTDEDANATLHTKYAEQGLDTWALAEPTARKAVEQYFGITSRPNRLGAMSFDANHKHFEAARKKLYRVSIAFQPESTGAKAKKAAATDPRAVLERAIKKADLTYAAALRVLNKVYGK